MDLYVLMYLLVFWIRCLYVVLTVLCVVCLWLLWFCGFRYSCRLVIMVAFVCWKIFSGWWGNICYWIVYLWVGCLVFVWFVVCWTFSCLWGCFFNLFVFKGMCVFFVSIHWMGKRWGYVNFLIAVWMWSCLICCQCWICWVVTIWLLNLWLMFRFFLNVVMVFIVSPTSLCCLICLVHWFCVLVVPRFVFWINLSK